MNRIPILLPTFSYPKKNPEHPCPCEGRPVELTHKTCAVYWQREVGALLQEGELVAEAEADKKTVELLAPAGGRLAERCVEDGDCVKAGQVIGYLEGEA